jgi:hypothetical protein
MNKKAILRELIKDKTIKALYAEGWDRSVIHKLILEELTESDSEQEIARLKGELRAARRNWKNGHGTMAEYEETRERIQSQLAELEQPALPVPQPKLAQQIVKTGTNYPDYQLEVVNKLHGVAIANPAVLDLISTLNIEEQQAMINHAVDAVDVTAPAPDEGNKEATINNINLDALYAYLDKARKSEAPKSNAIVLAQPMVDPIADDEVQDLEPEVVNRNELTGIIISAIQNQLETDEGQILSAIVVSNEKSKEDKIEAIKQLTNKIAEEKPAVKQLDNKVIEQEVVKQIAKSNKPEKGTATPGTIDPKKYLELYNKHLSNPFDDFEDMFLTTPFLGEQSKSISNLYSGLLAFGKDIAEQKKQSFNKPAPDKELQEQNEYPIVKFSPKGQRLIMSEHKDMEKYLKTLVKMILSVDEKKINTVGFEQDSKEIRAIAKKLMDSVESLIKIVENATKEERKGLEFAESLNEVSEDDKPRTQLTRDQIIDFMENGYAKVVDHLTNIERETRNDAKAIETKTTGERITKAKQVINSMLPYFPAHSPFGKEGSLKEIKKQVRAISRDMIQIMNQAKGIVKKPDGFDEKAIRSFSQALLSITHKLSQYFDLEIDDAEIKALLPKVPSAKSAGFGSGSQGLFDKIQKVIKKFGPTAKEKYEETKDTKSEASVLSKITEFFKKKIGEVFKSSQIEVSDNQEQSVLDKVMESVVVEEDEHSVTTRDLTDAEKKELFSSFAKHVAGKKTEITLKRAAKNWFSGLEPGDILGGLKRLGMHESKDPQSLSNAEEKIYRIFESVVLHFISEIEERSHLGVIAGALGTSVIDKMSDVVEKYLMNKYKEN